MQAIKETESRSSSAESDTARSTAAGWLTAGGLAGGLAAMSCCIVPLALFGIGVGGAWIGNLTALAPYQPYFAAFALACVGFGLWTTRRPRTADTLCRPAGGRAARAGLWTAAAMIAAALAFPYVAPLLLGA